MLHRGEYAIKGETNIVKEETVKGWKVLGTTKEFTRSDKGVVIATYTWTALWTLVFIIGTIYNLTTEVKNETWMQFWKIYTYIYLFTSIVVTIWFTIGGLKNLKEMIHALRTMVRDHKDSGYVEK
jgi:solute:Na+ symporter, SSS family